LLTVEGYSDPPRISDLGFEVNSGELVLVLGDPGAGKSRLMDALAGLRPEGGARIRIGGLPPSRKEARCRCSYVFQSGNFDGNRPVRKQMERVLGLYGPGPARAGSAVSDWARRWGIRSPGRRGLDMDLGSLQAAALGIGLLPDTELVVMDEPAQNLDQERTRMLTELLGDRGSRAVLALVSPPSPLATGADRIVFINGQGSDGL
jgi:ABC-type multidrug transport system ATPase subunit